MPLVAKDSGDFISVPPGMHLARCYRIIDQGTQKTEFNGEEKYQRKVMIQFEIHSEDDAGKPLVTSDGKPLSIAKTFTLTLSENSNLRKDLQMWRGREFTAQELRGFELKNVLGAWAMLSVIHKESGGKVYSNIAAINPVPRAMKEAGLPKGSNELKMFDIEEPDMALFDTFSENLKNKITSSPEWREREGTSEEKPGGASFDTNGLDDDIPF